MFDLYSNTGTEEQAFKVIMCIKFHACVFLAAVRPNLPYRF